MAKREKKRERERKVFLLFFSFYSIHINILYRNARVFLCVYACKQFMRADRPKHRIVGRNMKVFQFRKVFNIFKCLSSRCRRNVFFGCW